MNHVPHNQDENDTQLDLDDSSLSGYARIGLALGVLVTGFLLVSLGRGFPPLVWRLFFLMLTGHKSLPLNNGLIILQSIFLLIAWVLLLLVVIRIVRPQRAATLTIRGQEQAEDLERDGLYSLLTSTPLDIKEPEQWSPPSSERFWQYQLEHSNQQPDENRSASDAGSTLLTFNPLLTINPFEQPSDASHESSTDLLQASGASETLHKDGEGSNPPSFSRLAVAQESSVLQMERQEDTKLPSPRFFPGGHFSREKDEMGDAARITHSPSSHQAADKEPVVQSPSVGKRLKNASTWLEVQEAISPSQELASNKEPSESVHEVAFPQLLTLTTDSSRGPAQVATQKTRFMEFLSQPRRKWLDWEGWSACCSGYSNRPDEQDQAADYLLIATGIRTGPELMPFTLAIIANGSSFADEEQTIDHLIARTIGEALLSILWRGDTLDQKTAKRLLIKGMQYANGTLYRENQKHETAKTATAIVLLILNNIAYIASVGDNRAYYYRSSEGLIQITSTHSSADSSQERKGDTASKSFELPEHDHSTYRLGQRSTIQVDTSVMALNANDLLIFCSEGLQKLIRKGSFQQIIERALAPAASFPSLLCSTLVQEAQIEGSGDHTSVLVLHIKARVS